MEEMSKTKKSPEPKTPLKSKTAPDIFSTPMAVTPAPGWVFRSLKWWIFIFKSSISLILVKLYPDDFYGQSKPQPHRLLGTVPSRVFKLLTQFFKNLGNPIVSRLETGSLPFLKEWNKHYWQNLKHSRILYQGLTIIIKINEILKVFIKKFNNQITCFLNV